MRNSAVIIYMVALWAIYIAVRRAGYDIPKWADFAFSFLVVALVGEYNEYVAHSAVLSGVDNELSQKWEVLWKWYIGLLLGTFGCLFVALILPILGAIAALGCSVGSIVVGILKLVYLYRTAKEFREYPAGVR